jgi:UDP-N-acetylmuramyl-tripeptide synthetase/UDP-N-acetylmuramoyl-tripeptide--D-alanyl-D-alanine ligase
MQANGKMIELRLIVDILKEEGLLQSIENASLLELDAMVHYPETDTRAISATADTSTSIKSFVSIRGEVFDGHKLAGKAVDLGIKLLFVEEFLPDVKVMQIVCNDTRKALALLAKLYFDDPSSKFCLIGVTGTNGKTSTVTIISNILRAQGLSVGSIGTLGYTINDSSYPLERTTPDITELNTIFAKKVNEGVNYVVMEVSSHALKLDRVYGLKFDFAIFTNLSRDHLDFHPDMEDYYQSKRLLFDYLADDDAICLINVDDTYGSRLYSEIPSSKIAITSDKSKALPNSLLYEIIEMNRDGSKVSLSFLGDLWKGNKTSLLAQSHTINTPLIGDFNAFNTVISIATSLLADTNLGINSVVDAIPKAIPGRLQKIITASPIDCYVDYAHTPDAVEHTCKTLSRLKNEEHTKRHDRLITIIGSGGNRDKGKRGDMLDSAIKHSDVVIVTTDNPRDEKPTDIIIDMVAHLHPMSPYWVVCDRHKAIETAVNIACNNDIILIAGKGHETYQEIQGVKIPFDDRLIAKELLEAKWSARKDTLHTTKGSSYSPSSIKTAVPIDLIQLYLLFEKNSLIKQYLTLDSTLSQPNTDDKDVQRIEELKLKFDTFGFSYTYESISTDTRTIQPPAIYFALKGDNFDGHMFVESVISEEGSIAIVNADYKNTAANRDNLIHVKDTRLAYGLLAKKFNSLFNKETVAITGSVGKTTTKEYTYNILSTKATVLKNFANENNILGVSKTLFRLNSDYEYLVIELGSSLIGEIETLANITEPTYAIVTNISTSHLEFFKSLDGVFTEKSSLLRRNLKARIVSASEHRFDNFPYPLVRVNFNDPTSVGIDVNADSASTYNIHSITSKENGINFKVNEESYSLASEVPFLAYNAGLSTIVATLLGYSAAEISSGLTLPVELSDRMEITQINNRHLISDCYNASPLSMKSALIFLSSYRDELPHLAIIGDMLELGPKSIELHKEIGEYLAQIKEDYSSRSIFFNSISIGTFATEYNCTHHFPNVNALLETDLLESIPQECVILLKASRSIHLETIKGRL